MPDNLDSQELEDEVETDPSEPHAGRSFGKGVAEFLLEIFNPVEAFFEDPRLGLAVLVFIAAAAVIVFMGMGIWAAVQETFFAGGPPQGLGLK